jgi:hypothetical protein
LTVDQIEAKAPGAAATSSNLGPLLQSAYEEGRHAGSLRAQGLIKCVQHQGDDVRWSVTAKGAKLAKTIKARPRSNADTKVPPEILDPAVIAFRATRTYGIEWFSEEDIDEIREQLGDDYEHVTADDLRMQITNRRKQGAFVDPKDRIKKAVERAIREFGPEGTILPDLIGDYEIAKLQKLLRD